jgi:hypothetical protein
MKMKFKSDVVKSLALLILIVAIPIVGFHLNKAPQPISNDAPLTEFSAVRAMKHLEHIASKPHSIGTNEHSKVRDYIVEELKKMGIKPEIQITEVFFPDKYLAATVKNIIVTVPGTETGKSVLIAGHYDSVRDSYGASDDGSAVVTMLETIRLLRLKQPFKNDIIFLFTDGEEIGLAGASAFIEEHPLAKNVGLVLNFDGGGTNGPSMMFETSADNNWIISEFAKVVPFPIANSLSYEIYRNMPNDTDLTPFKNKGFKGFNFAYIENKFDYHTGSDNIKNTSVESIQHHGSYAASLTQHFANIDLNNSEKGNAVYFNTIGNGFVHYSDKSIVPFIILTCLTLLGILFIGFRRKIIRPLRLLFGFFAFIIHLAIAPTIVTLIYFILIKYYPGNDFRLLFYNQNILLIGFVGIATAVSFLFYKSALRGVKIWQLIPFITFIILLLIWSGYISLITVFATIGISVIIWFLYRKPTNVWELSFGSFIGWTILMVTAGVMMPGVSFLFTWPLMFSLVSVGIYFLRKNHTEYSILQISLFLLFALPALLWLSNLTYLFLIAMGLKMAGGAILFTVLCLSLLIIHIEIITRTKPWLVPLISFSAGLFLLLYGSVNLEYSKRYKEQNTLILATNGNTNETFFTSLNDKTDEWTVDYLSEHPDTSKLKDFFPLWEKDFIKNTVVMGNMPLPHLIIIKDSIIDNQRLVKFHINSIRNADNLFVYIKSNSDSIKVRINESEMKELKPVDKTEWFLIRYYAFPEEGIDMELKLLEKQNIEISLTDFIYSLPVLSEIKIKHRPDYMMSNGDMTMATKKFTIRN